ncbi:hypothetical protein, partial [Flavonifractor plautii]|uniref:hypothetical protein n=1 Tax=Flavonifractor plautii TaxID=292800 RepID=UPI003D7C4A51
EPTKLKDWLRYIYIYFFWKAVCISELNSLICNCILIKYLNKIPSWKLIIWLINELKLTICSHVIMPSAGALNSKL